MTPVEGKKVVAKSVHITPKCVLCNQNILEARDHLFWTCTFAKRFWRGILPRIVNLPITDSIKRVWVLRRNSLQDNHRVYWDTLWAGAVWALWRERNRRIFAQERKELQHLITETNLQINVWYSIL
ncbi:hypothetical protein FCM35_KLT20046 [Carex littledalei]|uniref:Reverse transcriptase zinc-binding domain-containing protein n=1 Tax=Carex littledalei TaxID=544730 RepID=A0A833RIA4_9POAL|nr:hypothetical protein FCM35_KLT20046 [Carex littledalei]